MTNTTSLAPCTTKQVSFIATLCQQRDTSAIAQDIVVAREHVMAGTLTKFGASKLIESLMAQPRVPSARNTAEPEDGIYRIDGQEKDEIYKVYKMVHGSGRQGVKRLEISFVDGEASGSFVYLGLAVKHLPVNAVKMSLEDAQEFGRIYGFCVKCGRTLTDETSIFNGIGPVCAGKGW